MVRYRCINKKMDNEHRGMQGLDPNQRNELRLVECKVYVRICFVSFMIS